MTRFFPNEQWKEFQLDYKSKFRYAISNYGRLMSFVEKFEDGRLLKGGTIEGYKIFRYKILIDKKIVNRHLFFHKLVAKNFLTKSSEDQVFVLHLDRNRGNNHIDNLKWATKQEMTAHSKTSPFVIEARKNKKPTGIGHKLTDTKVRHIKKRIFDPNRKTRMKMIARQFGISEMQLYRIKSGENWGHVKIG